MNDNIDYRFKSPQSFSHMVGCITALLIDYVKAPFGDNFFKTIRVTTEVPYHERSTFLRSVGKKERPMLVIEPKFDISEDTKFMPNSEFDSLVGNDYIDGMYNMLNIGEPIIVDKDNKYMLFGSGARYKISFNLIFLFDSEIQQMQVQEHMRLNIRHQYHNVVERFIEQNIPQNFMEAIALTEGLDINSDEFIQLMNTYSEIPITHRIRPGSQNKEFFIMTPRELDILFTSLPNSNGPERKGKVISSASFTETVEIEFAAKSSYFLRTNKDVTKELDMTNGAILSETTIKPTVTIPIAKLLNPLPDSEDGYKKAIQLNVQFENKDTDELELMNYIPKEVQRIYDYHKKQNISINFMKVKMNENDVRLDNLRFSFDAETMILTLNKPDAYKGYLVGLYVDYNYINKLKTSIISYDDYQDIKNANK